MQIWPAVEIRSGKCVRPTRGDYRKQTEKETVYGENPADMAVRWVNDGATGLHVVDLDAAIGEPNNIESICAIAEQTNVPIQLGGGIRDESTVDQFLAVGIHRLVIGTQAMKDPAWFAVMAKKYPGRILLGLDSFDGNAVASGRQEHTNLTVSEFAQEMATYPIAGIVLTDIAKSGILAGPNFDAQQQLRNTVDIPVIACGGVATIDHAARLAAMGINGCVIGRALYEGRLTLMETQMAIQQASFQSNDGQDTTQNSVESGASAP